MPWPQRGQGVQPWAQAHGSLAPQGRPHVLASMPSPDISRRPRAVGSRPRLHAPVPTELFVLLTHSPWADAYGFITWSLRNYSCSLLTHRGLTPTALSPGPCGTIRAPYS